jgi:hypothetical protein
MIARVNRRHRTDRHGGLTRHVRDYLRELGGRREVGGWSRIRSRAERSYSVLEDVVDGVDAHQTTIKNTSREANDALAQLAHAVDAQQAAYRSTWRTYVAQSHSYLAALEARAAGEPLSEQAEDSLRESYERAYEDFRRVV